MLVVDTPARIEDLDLHDHACWVPTSPQEQRGRLTRYISTGLARGERVAFFGAPARHSETVSADLVEAGVAVDELTARGQLIFASAEEQYLRGGTFQPQERLRNYAEAVQSAVDEGYGGFRVAAEVAWLAERPDARRSWPSYELGADLLAARLPFTALCVYHQSDWEPRELALAESLHSFSIRDRPRTVSTGFRVHARRDGSIGLRGELDMAYAAVFGDILAEAVWHGATVLDLSDLSFADVAGMRMIAMTCQLIGRVHGTATIRGASPTFRRTWRLAAFDAAGPAIVME